MGRYLHKVCMAVVAVLCVATLGQAAATVQTLDYDVVVVGGGGSGACAGLSAAQAGAKVLVIEKGRQLGGSSALTKGMMGVNTSLQKARHMELTPKDIFKRMEDYTHLLFNARLGRMTVEKSADTIDWLMDNGVKLWLPGRPQQYAHDAEEPIIYHMWDGHQGMAALQAAIVKAGGDLLLRTEATKIYTNADGSMKGVHAEGDDGTLYEINAKAVVVATGGYIGDNAMLKANGIVGHPMGWLPSDGVGLKMAWAAGATKYKEEVTQYHGTGIVTADNRESVLFPKLEALIHIPILWVDQTGQRYYNEDYVYDNALVSHALVSIGGEGMVVFDQKMVDTFSKEKVGLTDSFAQIRGIEGGFAGPLPTLQQDLEAGVSEGIVFKGKNLEELAAKAGFLKDEFIDQVADYNTYVANKDDQQFFKSAKSLLYPVSEGPFYALKVVTYNLTTIGGIKVNEKLEAVTPDFKPIKGLYAAGNVVGGLYSDSYMVIEGLTMGFAAISGREAGTNSAEYAKSLR